MVRIYSHWVAVMSSARRELGLRTCIATVLLCMPCWLDAQAYRNPPEVLQDAVDHGVQAIIQTHDQGGDAAAAAEELDQVWSRLVFYAVADAIAGQDLNGIRGLRAYRYLGETARTDKEVGASSGALGTTTVTEKPGLPMFLSFALEHGAIEREISGTNLTLSSSPYAFIKLWEPDNGENFSRYGVWRRIGVSATFNMSNAQAADSGTLHTDQIVEWSAKVRLLGDRSTRSPAFTRMWQDEVQPLIQKRLNAIAAGESAALNGTPGLLAAADSALFFVRGEIARYLEGHESAAPETKRRDLTDRILSTLKLAIVDPVAAQRILISASTRQEISARVDELALAHQGLLSAEERVGGILERLNRSLLLTVDYTNHQSEVGSDYSDLKLLFEDYIAPFNLVANADLSLYHHPDHSLNQSTLRAYGGSFTLEGAFDNFLSPAPNAGDLSKIILSASLRVSRIGEIADEMTVGQVKLSIPVSPGMTLPVSLTWANRTDLIDEGRVRGNFGFSIDFDKLYSILHSTPR